MKRGAEYIEGHEQKEREREGERLRVEQKRKIG